MVEGETWNENTHVYKYIAAVVIHEHIDHLQLPESMPATERQMSPSACRDKDGEEEP